MLSIDFAEINELKQYHVYSINRLLSQLSPNAEMTTIERLNEIMESKNTHLFLATVDGNVAGMCSLALYTTPTGRKAWIEDVVVDKDYRGMKIGRQMIEKAIKYAHKYSPCTIMLTSKPSRIAANALYSNAGFDRKNTNVYKMDI